MAALIDTCQIRLLCERCSRYSIGQQLLIGLLCLCNSLRILQFSRAVEEHSAKHQDVHVDADKLAMRAKEGNLDSMRTILATDVDVNALVTVGPFNLRRLIIDPLLAHWILCV